MSIQDLEIGQVVYREYMSIGAIEELEYIGADKFKSRSHNKIINMWPTDYKFLHYTRELAECSVYLYKLNNLQQKIDEAKKQLSKSSKELKQLNDKFGYLKDKYPEEFV